MAFKRINVYENDQQMCSDRRGCNAGQHFLYYYEMFMFDYADKFNDKRATPELKRERNFLLWCAIDFDVCLIMMFFFFRVTVHSPRRYGYTESEIYRTLY